MGAIDVRLGQVQLSSVAEVLGEASKHLLEHAFRDPGLKPTVAGLVWWISPRQIGPRSAGPKNPKDAIYDVPRVTPGPATFRARPALLTLREAVLDRIPLLIGEVHPHL
jgi:hypothetical protein